MSRKNGFVSLGLGALMLAIRIIDPTMGNAGVVVLVAGLVCVVGGLVAIIQNK